MNQEFKVVPEQVLSKRSAVSSPMAVRKVFKAVDKFMVVTVQMKPTAQYEQILLGLLSITLKTKAGVLEV